MRPSHRLLVGASLLLAGFAFPAAAVRAAVSVATIGSETGFTNIAIGNDLSCQITVQGDAQPSFEPVGSALGDCGTYILATDTSTNVRTLFGPSDRVALPPPDQPYTPDTNAGPNGQQQTTDAGTGVSAINTRVLLGSTGLTATETDVYHAGDGFLSSGVEVQNTTSSTTYNVVVAHVFVCYLQGGTGGDFGVHDIFVGLYQNPGCTTGPGVTPARAESITGLSDPSDWVVAQVAEAAGLLRAGTFPNTCFCGQASNLMVGISFDRGDLAPGASESNYTFQTRSGAAAAVVTTPTPKPQALKSGVASVVSGIVRVKVPGGKFVLLTGTQTVPVGSILDTAKGVVRLRAATNTTGKTGTGDFGGGMFKFSQKYERLRRKRLLATPLTLRGGNFAACRTRSADGQSARRRTVRYLNAKANGQFEVVGQNSKGLERGTTWKTSDTCDGTLTVVTKGKVLVTDRVKRKTILVRAGKSYLARPRRR